jgi:hypothetical protein
MNAVRSHFLAENFAGQAKLICVLQASNDCFGFHQVLYTRMVVGDRFDSQSP